MTDSTDLGKQLRAMYEDGPIGSTPVPQALLDRLAELEAEQNKDKKKQDG